MRQVQFLVSKNFEAEVEAILYFIGARVVSSEDVEYGRLLTVSGGLFPDVPGAPRVRPVIKRDDLTGLVTVDWKYNGVKNTFPLDEYQKKIAELEAEQMKVKPILDYKEAFEKVLSTLRRVNARFIDFAEDALPASIGDCLVSFNELEDEIKSIIEPVLEEYDATELR